MFRRALILVAVSMALVGCVDSDPGPDTSTPTTAVVTSGTGPESTTSQPTDTTTDTTEPGPGGQITVLVDDLRAVALAETAAAYTADTGIEVVFSVAPIGEIRDRASSPDVDVFVGPHLWLDELWAERAIGAIDGVDSGVFTNQAVSAFLRDDQMLAVPYSAEALVLYRNTELVPAPLADLTDGCAADVFACFTMPGVGSAGGYHLAPFVMAGAGAPLGALTEPGDPRAIQALAGLVSDGSIVLESVTGARQSFLAGRAGHFIGGPWDLGPIEDSGIAFSVGPLPPAGGSLLSAPVAVQGFYLSATAPSAPEALTFIVDYLAEPSAQRDLYERDRRSPVVDLDDLPDHARAFEAAVDNGFLLPSVDLAILWEELGLAFEAIAGGADPVDSIRQALGRARSRLDG